MQFFAMARGRMARTRISTGWTCRRCGERNSHQPARSQLGGDAVVALRARQRSRTHVAPDPGPGHADRAGLIAAIVNSPLARGQSFVVRRNRIHPLMRSSSMVRCTAPCVKHRMRARALYTAANGAAFGSRHANPLASFAILAAAVAFVRLPGLWGAIRTTVSSASASPRTPRAAGPVFNPGERVDAATRPRSGCGSWHCCRGSEHR